ncbi:hypothetical protein BDF14DRAFT_1747619 [Spinellus fusiger]|nr:hypothetical protein BDF14DRAFT_1747619 [Spinellus fusiger]
MTHVLHFETSFWSQKQPSSTSPDFYSGLSVLHQKLQQSRVENDEVITFFKDRIAIEESYGNKLLDQARESSKTTGFGRDEGAALKSCFENLKTASGQLGARHHITATTMTESALKPLQAFHEDYKKTLTTSRSSVEAKIKQFDGLLKETERAKALYHRRCREADAAEEQAAFMAVEELHKGNEKQPSAAPPPSKSQSVQLGTQTFSPGEFDLLLQRMRQEIPTKDHRIPILGTYKATSTGEEVSRWLQLHLPQCKDSPAMADIVGQQLIQNHNVLRLIGQRGNKFLPSNTSVYQWRIRDPEEVASLGVSALGGILEKIGSGANGYASVQGDELYKRARLEAEKTDEAYRSAVKRLDTMRTVIEEALFSHFSEMEKVELTRLDTLKQGKGVSTMNNKRSQPT